jgi:hypothetical protein
MKFIEIEDFNDVDFVDEMLRAIEKDYGRSIARIANFKPKSPLSFEIVLVFTDFKVFIADIDVIQHFGFCSVQVNGIYY